jgi:hypothetical protein
MILKILNLAQILAFFDQATASFCKNMIITLVFEKNANFVAEDRRKSQKIEIITSTPEISSVILFNSAANRWSVRIPPGCKVLRSLYPLQCSC